MTTIGPSLGIFDPTHPIFSYTDCFGAAVDSSRARFSQRPVWYLEMENVNPGSRVRFRTDAPDVTIKLYFNNLYTTTAFQNAISFLVNGVLYSTVDPADTRAAYQNDITLNFGSAVFRTVEVIFPYCAGLDFTGLAIDPRYRVLPCLPRSAQKLLSIGDSITEGLWTTSSAYTWPFLLAASKNWQSLNLGIGGGFVATHGNGSWAAAVAPDVITTMLGYNNFGSQTAIATFKSQYTTLLNGLLSATSCKIYVITPTWSGNTSTITLAQYRTAVAEVVAAIGNARLTLVDGLSLAANSTAHFPDSVHPNDAGCAAIASALSAIVSI